ncbi:unnamed protein product [Caenorhabditis auriculariae]|uniref:Uncharacterized protein n=1 Tax=Caenorhabditis auriculariae TaxID=2777116 RepID=A0A8S1HUX6_9PELO|nr:unnamed protein product [Caenorhabditis auriculariae]
MSVNLIAGRGVTQVVIRCEEAKTSGYLDLSSCSLMFIADAIYLLLKGYEIDKVNLRNNGFKKFPKKMVTKFPNLTIFNMEGNEIEEVPTELGSWTNLKGINGANNKLQKFPEGIYELQKLVHLDLSGNLISELDVDRLYENCQALAQLNLSENPLSQETKESLKNHPKKPAKLVVKL